MLELSEKAYQLDGSKILQELESTINGLSSQEANLRLKEYGPNQLAHSREITIFEILLRQFKNPFIYVLVFALAISIATGHMIDVGIILATILISAIIGAFQEYKADRSLTALKKIVHSEAKVIRDGVETIIPQEEIVTGDILKLKSGDKVLADSRILSAKELEVNEATLTGESLPILKSSHIIDSEKVLADRDNMLYSGTIISAGSATAAVIATGYYSEIGKIANLIKETSEDKTPLQKELLNFGKNLSIALVVLNIAIFLLGIFSKKPLYEMFLTSVALVVAAIPEGLVPAMSIILAAGMQKLVKKKGLVKKMLAAETLGSVSTICTDKTGTLTTGEMSLAHIVATDRVENERELLKAATLCNEAIVKNANGEDHEIKGNPTDRALIKAAHNHGLDKAILENLEPKVAEIAFNSAQKYMATLHQNKDELIAYIKGAPEKILEMSQLSDKEKERFNNECSKVTGIGYRVIAIASKKFNQNAEDFNTTAINDLDFLGLIALKDPLRPEAKPAIKLCLEAGIKPIILTGDHKKTAFNIAQELGLDVNENTVLEGKDIEHISFSDLCQKVKDVKIFARVEPKHKIQIVSALQANNEIVAMTGDGVNDSPALKKADIGVAVGSGTEIAKETADLILLDDNFMTIVEAIKSGRIIFNNLRKVILCLLIDSCSEMIVVTGSIALGLPLPILPAQILWVKLIEDTFPAVSLSFEELDEKVMENMPRKKDEPILNKYYIQLIVSYTVIMDLSLLFLFNYIYQETNNLDYARTVVFVCLGITTLVGVFSIRSIKYHIWQISPFSNKLLVFSCLLSGALYILAIYNQFFNKILKTIQLDSTSWGIIFLYSIFSILVYESCKKLTIMKQS